MASDEATIRSSLDLFRRLPPQKIQSNLDAVLAILPEELGEELLTSIDQPLAVKVDAQTGRHFLVCDYNRDGGSYRSPWSNTYDPPIQDGTMPSEALRKLELDLNDAFDVYREMYYEGGTSSVYLWDLEDGTFAGVVLLKKSNDTPDDHSSWDSVHVFESAERGRTIHYKLTSTIMLYLSNPLEGVQQAQGDISLGGSMTRQAELDAPYDPSTPASITSSHVCGLGKAIEDMETKMRNSLDIVYFSKTTDVVDSLRSTVGYGEVLKRQGLQSELVGLLRKKS